MNFANLIDERSVLVGLNAGSRKQIFQALAERAGNVLGIPARVIFDRVLERERLGSTAIGGGVAIPHARVPELDAPFGMFARLARSIPYDFTDQADVDLVFLLLAPETTGTENLKVLARIARLFRDREFVARIRRCGDESCVHALLTLPPDGISTGASEPSRSAVNDRVRRSTNALDQRLR